MVKGGGLQDGGRKLKGGGGLLDVKPEGRVAALLLFFLRGPHACRFYLLNCYISSFLWTVSSDLLQITTEQV